MVALAGWGDDVVIAALLHDAVEDSDTTLAEIGAAFGESVATLVETLTDREEWRELPRRERKSAQARHIGSSSVEARALKIADQTANLNDIARNPGPWLDGEGAEYLSGAMAVVDACRGVDPTLERAFDAAAAAVMEKLSDG